MAVIGQYKVTQKSQMSCIQGIKFDLMLHKKVNK